MQDQGANSQILVSQRLSQESIQKPSSSPFLLKLRSINSHSYFMKINCLSATKSLTICDVIAGSRQIKPKMITKVLTWLEKLCKETLKFSTQTFQRTARILLQYLLIVDQPICNLQLVGCACLYLSSKISQSTIIAAESYAECSCNIFTKEDLMNKESQIYATIGAKSDFVLLQDIYQFIREETTLKEDITDIHDQKIKKIISSCIKDVQCLAHEQVHLLFSLLKQIVFLNAQLNIQDFKFNLKNSIFFNRK